MISGQTLRVCPEGKPVPTFPDHAAGNKKAPDLFEARLRLRECDRELRARVSRSPAGLCGFRGAFGVHDHGSALCARFRMSSTGFRAKNRLDTVEQDAVVTP